MTEPMSTAQKQGAQPDYLTAVTKYRRIHDTIHRATCSVLKRYDSLPWIWAEDLDVEFIRHSMQEHGLHGCLVCGAP